MALMFSPGCVKKIKKSGCRRFFAGGAAGIKGQSRGFRRQAAAAAQPAEPKPAKAGKAAVKVEKIVVAAGVKEDLQINPRIGDKLTGALRQRAEAVVPPDWTVKCVVRRGKPHKVVPTYAAEQEADLLAVGTDTRHDLGERLVGSTSVRIVRHAPCPTLIC